MTDILSRAPSHAFIPSKKTIIETFVIFSRSCRFITSWQHHPRRSKREVSEAVKECICGRSGIPRHHRRL